MIQVPNNFKKTQEEMTKKKIEEAKEKLDKFLEEENLFVGAVFNYGTTQISPEIVVLPKDFLAKEKLAGDKSDTAILK